MLDVLGEDEAVGVPCTVSELGRRLGVDQPRASKLVNLSASAGLLVRERDAGDARRTVLRLTSAGRMHLAQIHQFRRSVFSAAMQEWGDQDREAFAVLLTRFVAAIDGPQS